MLLLFEYEKKSIAIDLFYNSLRAKDIHSHSLSDHYHSTKEGVCKYKLRWNGKKFYCQGARS